MVKLVVGLGNPGPEYLFTRHNVGFMVVDLLAQRWGVKLKKRGFSSIYALAPQGVYLVKPQTYMNESGEAVKKWISQGFLPQEMLVIHDVIDLPLGTVRIKAQGGTGGHKGLQSIVQASGTDAFPRIRVGVGRPVGREHDHQAIIDFLLSPFEPHEEETLVEALRLAAKGVEAVLRKGLDGAMNLINKRR